MKNVVKSTFRNFKRRPVTNLINLTGLSVSLALVIILSMYGYRELTTDHHHKNGEHVFLYGKTDQGTFITPGILKEHIDLKIPEVKSTVRITATGESAFQVDKNEPINTPLFFGDEDFFKLFTYKSVAGDLENALKQPLSIIITNSLSKRLFGAKQALGKVIKINDDKELTVSAVIEEPETNSCFSFDAITSIATLKAIEFRDESKFTQWGRLGFQTFILLDKGASPIETNKKITALFPTMFQENYKKSSLLSLQNLYFSKTGIPFLTSGDKKKVIILIIVGVLVLIIALLNFINISSSQWIEKVRQTGIQKVIGASRKQIFSNIVLEAFLMFLTALFLAIILKNLANPFIQRYTGINFNSRLAYTPLFYAILVAGSLVLSVLSSVVPALRISSSKAVHNLKKTVNTNTSSSSLKGMLVAIQFTITIALIAFTILVQKQVNYGCTNLGFNQDNIISIKFTQQLNQKKEVLKKLLLEKPTVNKISLAQFYPGSQPSMCGGAKLELNGENQVIEFNSIGADAEFFNLMGLKLVKGRFYTNDLSEKAKLVVNETFLHKYNMDNPIGAKISGMCMNGNEIIGVVKDFHFRPVNEPITPLIIRNDENALYSLVSIKTENFNSLHSIIQDIKLTASKLSPAFPVEVSFFDQGVENMYQTELQFRKTFSLFAVCSIIICCLGILAMSLFACQQRTKEIGIRKVNGARVTEILAMLNQDFIKWVALAFIIACPIAYYAMNQWLQSFAYKTELSWWVFAVAGIVAVAVAVLTVSWQSWRAATRNPVESLRYE